MQSPSSPQKPDSPPDFSADVQGVEKACREVLKTEVRARETARLPFHRAVWALNPAICPLPATNSVIFSPKLTVKLLMATLLQCGAASGLCIPLHTTFERRFDAALPVLRFISCTCCTACAAVRVFL